MKKEKVLIAITGTMLSGKSTALDIFRKLGACAISADDIVHSLFMRDDIIEKIRKQLGTTERQSLAKQVFYDEDKRKKLEGILHPIVIKTAMQIARGTDRRIIAVEVPLLFESNLENRFDITLCISASRAAMLGRIKDRGLTKKDFEARSKAQYSADEKMALADIVIFNNSTPKDLAKKIKKIFKVIDN